MMPVEAQLAAPMPKHATMSDGEFRQIVRIASEVAGLAIPDSKIAMVQSRIARRLRFLGLGSFGEYVALISGEGARDEKRAFVSALTTNVSHFFRENHHFEFLTQTILPRLKQNLAEGRSARIWSAGCSSGEEPYSIAMLLAAAMPDSPQRDLRILGTDIDTAILHRAREAVYPAKDIEDVPPTLANGYFTALPEDPSRVTLCDSIRAMVTLRELNLHGPWPMKGQFDAIFCRNVVIYFDEAHQNALWPRFREALRPGGWLFLGHSERIQSASAHGLKNAGVTIYQKE